ncbi:MAG: hypothetical protein E6833_27345, partial [Bradyrhizobium sp.]|nr:hypothetical protein [Bradyrhizobium sp.]
PASHFSDDRPDHFVPLPFDRISGPIARHLSHSGCEQNGEATRRSLPCRHPMTGCHFCESQAAFVACQG